MKKIVFLHIEKTAGNTLHQILFNNRIGYVVFNFQKGRALTIEGLKKVQQKYPIKISGIGGHQIDCTKKNSYYGDDQFTFTILRDPLERYISNYNHMIVKKGFDFSFDEYLDGDDRLNNYQTKSIAQEANAEKAIYILKNNFDFVGIQEQMDKSLQLLGNMLELDCHQKPLNVTSKKLITLDSLSSEQLAKAKSNNNLDYQVYKAGLDLFESYDLPAKSIKVSAFRKVIGKFIRKVSLFWVNRVL